MQVGLSGVHHSTDFITTGQRGAASWRVVWISVRSLNCCRHRADVYFVLLLLLTCLVPSHMCNVIYCTISSIHRPLGASLWLCLRHCILTQSHSHRLGVWCGWEKRKRLESTSPSQCQALISPLAWAQACKYCWMIKENRYLISRA